MPATQARRPGTAPWVLLLAALVWSAHAAYPLGCDPAEQERGSFDFNDCDVRGYGMSRWIGAAVLTVLGVAALLAWPFVLISRYCCKCCGGSAAAPDSVCYVQDYAEDPEHAYTAKHVTCTRWLLVVLGLLTSCSMGVALYGMLPLVQMRDSFVHDTDAELEVLSQRLNGHKACYTPATQAAAIPYDDARTIIREVGDITAEVQAVDELYFYIPVGVSAFSFVVFGLVFGCCRAAGVGASHALFPLLVVLAALVCLTAVPYATLQPVLQDLDSDLAKMTPNDYKASLSSFFLVDIICDGNLDNVNSALDADEAAWLEGLSNDCTSLQQMCAAGDLKCEKPVECRSNWSLAEAVPSLNAIAQQVTVVSCGCSLQACAAKCADGASGAEADAKAISQRLATASINTKCPTVPECVPYITNLLQNVIGDNVADTELHSTFAFAGLAAGGVIMLLSAVAFLHATKVFQTKQEQKAPPPTAPDASPDHAHSAIIF